MNDPVLFLLAVVGVLPDVGWLAILEMRQGQNFRFDSSAIALALLSLAVNVATLTCAFRVCVPVEVE